MPRAFSYLIVAIVVLAWPSLLMAYTFTLSEIEFQTWSPHCKVVYLRTQPGKATNYERFVSKSDRVAAQAILGSKSPYGEGGIHHFCAGTKWLERARLESDTQTYDLYLRKARSETHYTLVRTREGSPTNILAATQMALVLHEQKEDLQALDLLDSVILLAPSYPMPYLAKATIHYRQRDYSLARDVLVQGDERMTEKSPDIQYNLGLILIKLGDPESAVRYARLAYNQGYPLPGLRRQLENLGYSLSSN